MMEVFKEFFEQIKLCFNKKAKEIGKGATATVYEINWNGKQFVCKLIGFNKKVTVDNFIDEY